MKILRINGKTYIITKLAEVEWMELLNQSSEKVYINEKRRSVYDSYETKIVEDQFNANIIGAMVAYPRSIFKSPLSQTDQHELISQCVDYQMTLYSHRVIHGDMPLGPTEEWATIVGNVFDNPEMLEQKNHDEIC